MELNDLRSEWQNAGGEIKSKSELLNMTKLIRHPSLKRIWLRLIIETVFLVFFSIVYYDWFDGEKNPLYANIVLLAGLLLFIANDAIGYIALAKPIRGLNLKLSIANYMARIKRLANFSLVFSAFYSVCLLVFFSSVINFNREKRFLLLGISVIMFQLVYWSFKVWNNRIQKLEQQVRDFDRDENG